MIWRKDYSQLEISFLSMKRKDLQKWKKNMKLDLCACEKEDFFLIDSQQKKTNMKNAMDE